MLFKYILIIFIITLNSCNSNKNLTSTFIEKSVKVGGKINLENDCPDNGKCELTIKENASIEIRKELKSKYPVIIEGNNTVYEYKYYQTDSEIYQDGNNYEVVLFELKDLTNPNLKDSELINIQAFFGKFCYCKDIAGYYQIENGIFTLTKDEINFGFLIPKLKERQILKKIQVKL